MPFLLDCRIAGELERATREVRCWFRFGGPDDGPVAVEEDAFAGGDVAALVGVGDWERAFWGDGEVEAVDDGEEGCEAAGAGGDVEVGFHVDFEAIEGGGNSWLEKEKKNQFMMMLRRRHGIELTSPPDDGSNDDAMNALISQSRVGRPRLWVACVVLPWGAIDGALEGVPINVLPSEEDAGDG